ncbi:hypothetical protein HYX06_01900 [Candidatus Woesearchaeota archaeon]|nr:hypothetical protein [Candidatus Woesearchaeota archaeon]
MPVKKEGLAGNTAPWFYYTSILVSFLFTMYVSVYSAIHFEDIRFMNLVLIFFFFTIISFFLISAVYFHTEKMGYHALAPVLFFAGVVGLIFYAYTANDASNIVRYSIMYTIAVAGISIFILLPRKKGGKNVLSKLPIQKSIKGK